MSSFIELSQARIAKKGIRASDIKCKDLLTQEQIQDIPIELVYAWVKTGNWSQKDFKVWLKALRVIE